MTVSTRPAAPAATGPSSSTSSSGPCTCTHSLLPPTPQWCYVARTRAGEHVNPTLQAWRGRRALVRYRNRLAGRTLPVRVTSVHGTDPATDGVVVVSDFECPGRPEPDFTSRRRCCGTTTTPRT